MVSCSTTTTENKTKGFCGKGEMMVTLGCGWVLDAEGLVIIL